MRNVTKLPLLLLLIIMVSLLNAEVEKNWVVIPMGNGMHTLVPYKKDDAIKKPFLDIKVSSEKGRRNFVIGAESTSKVKISSSIQGELSLKQWLISKDRYNIYILDKDRNYLEYYSELVYGEEYTIIDEETKFGQLVMKGEENIVFGDKYDGKTFTFGLEIIDFDMKFQFEVNGQEIDYKWMINQTHNFSFDEIEYKVDLTYSVVHHYLQTGELIFNQVGQIGGISWDLGKLSYERAKEGFELTYDSLFDDSNSYEFNFIIEKDVIIHFNSSEYVNISVNGVKINPEDIIEKGSKIEVVFRNNQNLDNYISIKEEECSILEQLSGECIEIDLAVIDPFDVDDYDAMMKIIVSKYNISDIPILKILNMTFQNNNGSTWLGGENNVYMYIQNGESDFSLITNTFGPKTLTSVTFEVSYAESENEPFTKTVSGNWKLGAFN